MMAKLIPHYLYFFLWLVAFTILTGLVGIWFPTFISILILLPFVAAFYLMGQHFVKKHRALPDKQERIHLSAGCTSIFWAYTFVAGYIGTMIAQRTFTPNLEGLWQALGNQMFVILFCGIFLCINAVLFGLAYWFLGKPAAIILKSYEK